MDSSSPGSMLTFILLVDSIAKSKERGLSRGRIKNPVFAEQKLNILKGSLLVSADNSSGSLLSRDDTSFTSKTSLLSKATRKKDKEKITLIALEHDNAELVCNSSDVKRLSSQEVDLLSAIPVCAERLKVFNDKNWIAEGLLIKEGNFVDVKLSNHQYELPGIVRYRGPVPNQKGEMFGIELIPKYRGQGTSDGTFRKQRFFKCPLDSAVFFPINKIRLHQGVPEGGEQLKVSPEEGVALSGAYALPPGHNPPLRIGERVVWMSDDGPEQGTVKWLGILPDQKETDVTVGVEFDRPVGTGTGKYKDQQLFRTPQNHASLIPIMGLLKEEELFPRSTKKRTLPVPSAPLPSFPSEDYGGAKHRQTTLGLQPHGPPTPTQGDVSPRIRDEVDTSRLLGLGTNEVDGSVPMATQEYMPPPDLEVGSMVEVLGNPPKFGVIRWIGGLPESKDPSKLVAGLEMEEESPAGTDGTFNGKRYFQCAAKKAFFVYLHKCREDSRFQESVRYVERSNSQAFGSVESPDEGGNVPPADLQDVLPICGKNKGIQGHHNSCYLDACLVAMFFCTHVFDSILHRPKEQTDLPEYEEVQRVLKESIVNPLRKHFYVRADKVLNLRKLLDKLGTVQGMMGEEKDPEEFLSSLLQQIMKADPFIKLSNGAESFCYQLFVEKDERIVLPTTQQLLGLSCLQSDIKFAEIPSCLMIQMPRFGKDYKMYNRIVPSLTIDITDVLDNAPRECTICGTLAEYECKGCYKDFGPGDSLDQIAFCEPCSKRSHTHAKRANHKPRRIKVPKEYIEYMHEQQSRGNEHLPIQRETMELFAVVCIETSHYVAFIKAGFGPQAPWIFYDSMADRMGEQHGYNIPEIQPCPDLADWLSDANHSRILSYKDDRHLPEHMRRLLCDAYMCFYQSTDVMMYK